MRPPEPPPSQAVQAHWQRAGPRQDLVGLRELRVDLARRPGLAAGHERQGGFEPPVHRLHPRFCGEALGPS
eukprot:12884243-Alexandrium_andersonii.AAC.1